MKIDLPGGAEMILESLAAHGFRGDIVGGSVRDALLGSVPYDFDITTDASPSEVKEIFRAYNIIDTGIKHGTVTVIVDRVPYEITTYRIDGEYEDNRHPKNVEFTRDIIQDLARRDFTVNAIAYNPNSGITDPYHGVEDLKAGTIRAVGDPEARFEEDALRILRAIRFAAKLGFKIDKRTEQALYSKRHLLSAVSHERIFSEWQKLLAGDYAYSVIEKYYSLLSDILPELGEFKLPKVDSFRDGDWFYRMLLLFAINSSLDGYACAMRRFKTSSAVLKRGTLILRLVNEVYRNYSYDKMREKYIGNGGEAVVYAAGLAEDIGIISYSVMLEVVDFSNQRLPCNAREMNIGGDDILTLGITGKRVGRALEALLHDIVFGLVKNEKNALLDRLKKLISEKII